MNLKLLLLVCVQCCCGIFVRYTPTIEIRQGRIKGMRALNGQHQYYGIPYADSERFQPPQPPKKWNDTFYATLQFDSCAQSVSRFHLGSESCLNLNVHTPPNSKDQKLPVLVFFHGGAYFAGSNWHFDPEFLVKKNVIIVIPNYRLGVLGFLCQNNVANLGLKDQVAALKWIQENIAAFGGDPDNVTISGQSAGAATASMMLLSNKTKGLYHKAIFISGVALSPWAFNVNVNSKKIVSDDAAKLRKVDNEIDVYNAFKEAPLRDLLNATRDTLIGLRYFKYTPCVDTNFTDAFFHDTPYNIIKSGDFIKVPMMLGVTETEGIIFYGLNSKKSLNILDESFTERLPSAFSWCSDEDKNMISNKLRSHYFGENKINSKAAIKGTIAMYSDYIAHGSVDAFSKLMATYSDKPVYNYLFSYEGDRNFVKAALDRGYGLKGATHCDDLFYMFQPFGLTLNLDKADELLIERYTTMITNFMKFGDPTPTESSLLPLRWPARTLNSSQVLRIDSPLSVTEWPAHVRGQFYLRLLCQHGISGYVPCDSAMMCNLEQ